MVPASEFLSISVPDWTDAGQSDIPSFIKMNKDGQGYNPHVHTGSDVNGYTLYVHTAGGGKC
jgi:hypothetical protein